MPRKRPTKPAGRGNHPNSRKNLKPIAPGEVRNPAGRKTLGATIREQLNALGEAALTEAQLRRIARDQSEPFTRRAAAERILRTLDHPDLADFAPVAEGKKTLKQLRDSGVNTECVKKLKPTEHGVEIELHDRGGEDFDRLVEQTDGLPAKTVKVEGQPFMATPQERQAEAISIADMIKKMLGRSLPRITGA